MAMGRVAEGVVMTVAAMLLGSAATQAASFTNTYTFGTRSADAANPSSGLIFDSAGNLYGPSSAGGASTYGALFELAPPSAGATTWTETVIHSFPTGANDGVRPQGRLLLAPTGSLYGTTNGGGGTDGDGTVFQLTPPTATSGWVLTTLYVFPQNKIGLGGAPIAGVLMDNAGAIYGTTPEQGAVKVSDVVPGMIYRLTPPAAGQDAWSFSTLYSFPVQKGHTNSPVSGLVADASGDLYGTVQLASTSVSQGAIYELTPSSSGNTAWTETTLIKLPPSYGSPVGDLTIDANGALYGTTSGGTNNGVAFRASPSSTTGSEWTLSILYVFGSTGGVTPVGGLTLGAGGQVYGNGSGGKSKQAAGVTYKLTPPASGNGRWTFTTVAQFNTKPRTSGQGPVGAPVVGSNGMVYGATAEGGTHGIGTAFITGP